MKYKIQHTVQHLYHMTSVYVAQYVNYMLNTNTFRDVRIQPRSAIFFAFAKNKRLNVISRHFNNVSNKKQATFNQLVLKLVSYCNYWSHLCLLQIDEYRYIPYIQYQETVCTIYAVKESE